MGGAGEDQTTATGLEGLSGDRLHFSLDYVSTRLKSSLSASTTFSAND